MVLRWDAVMPSRILFLEVRTQFSPVETRVVVVSEQNEALAVGLPFVPTLGVTAVRS